MNIYIKARWIIMIFFYEVLPRPTYHPQVIHEAGAVLPDFGGLARELSGAYILATIQLLDRCHHRIYRIKEKSWGELRKNEGEIESKVDVLCMHTHQLLKLRERKLWVKDEQLPFSVLHQGWPEFFLRGPQIESLKGAMATLTFFTFMLTSIHEAYSSYCFYSIL